LLLHHAIVILMRDSQTTHHVEREEFGRFTLPLLAQDQAIQALEWIPRVPTRSPRKYEEDARNDGFPSFQFTERTSGKLARAGEREEYFPVFFVAPFNGNEKALGFDLASDPVRHHFVGVMRISEMACAAAAETSDHIAMAVQQSLFMEHLTYQINESAARASKVDDFIETQSAHPWFPWGALP